MPAYVIGMVRDTGRLATAIRLWLAICLLPAVAAAQDHTGLWQGIARIDRVAEADHDPQPAAGLFRFRILLHVDAQGRAVLLKEAVILPGEEGDTILAAPARHLARLRLLPDDTLARARRIDSAAFDFPGDRLDLDGRFAPDGVIAARITLSPDMPSHPYLHRYHPDHDNRDDRTGAMLAGADRPEVPSVLREIEITLLPSDGAAMPDLLHAGYSETVTGLGARAIRGTGRIRLTRLSASGRIE